ncbi:MAG TPA: GNAT family N-acetyltransferase [Desulfomonilaceae bacterium]|nr:GNAT family N-acetyltransferase [Desulfomonilaceae bacterium]
MDESITETTCEYSQLTLPNDPSYNEVAAAYVGEIAEKFGFEENDRALIRTAVLEAVGNVIHHAFEPDERAQYAISCERAPLGLKITIKDRGLPADRLLEQCVHDPSTSPGQCRGISVMKDCVDEVEFRNQGPDGKEIILVKYLKNRGIADYFQACHLEPYVAPVPRKEPGENIEFSIRELKPSETVEVSRTVYRAYGYSYAYEHAYYPDRLADLIQSGRIFISAAVTPSGEIAGHCALIRMENAPRIAELGLGAVKPRFRFHGIFTALTEHLIREARSEGLMGIFGEAVTNHTFSQQTGHGLGLRDCALLVGYVPATASFKEITEELLQRETLVVQFLYLSKPSRAAIYSPPHHEDMILKIYQNLGASPEFLALPQAAPELSESVITTTASRSKDSAEIHVHGYGPNVLADMKNRVKELCLRQTDTIQLYLDLADPGTARFCKHFEEMGFFFSGVLPGGSTGDALILQYLNNVPIDYDKIKLDSETARELLAYVRSKDPNM